MIIILFESMLRIEALLMPIRFLIDACMRIRILLYFSSYIRTVLLVFSIHDITRDFCGRNFLSVRLRYNLMKHFFRHMF